LRNVYFSSSIIPDLDHLHENIPAMIVTWQDKFTDLSIPLTILFVIIDDCHKPLFDVCNSNQTGKGEAAGIVDIFTRGVNPRLLPQGMLRDRPYPG